MKYTSPERDIYAAALVKYGATADAIMLHAANQINAMRQERIQREKNMAEMRDVLDFMTDEFIERLEAEKAELLAALEGLLKVYYNPGFAPFDNARAAIAKAKAE